MITLLSVVTCVSEDLCVGAVHISGVRYGRIWTHQIQTHECNVMPY